MGAVFRLGYAEVSLFETHEPGFSDGEGAGCADLAQSFPTPRTRGIDRKRKEASFRRPRIRY